MLRIFVFSSTALKWAVKTSSTQHASPIVYVSLRSVVNMGDSDVLYQFIDTLMNNKIKKWKLKNEVNSLGDKGGSKSDTDLYHPDAGHDLKPETVDNYILSNIESPCLASYLKACHTKELFPAPETLLKVAQLFAKSGNNSGMDMVLSLADADPNSDEKRQAEIRIYQAEAMWRSGGSIERSLAMFYDLYKAQPSLRRFVRSSLRSLIGEVVECRGEASLVQVKNLVLHLAGPPYEDPIPLSFLWGRCVLSEWFADQQMAVEIINMGKGSSLFKRAVQNRLSSVVGEALAGHRVEPVYHVVEDLLRLSMNKQCEGVLGALFDYKYVMGEKKGCEAILALCVTAGLDVGFTRRKKLETAEVRWKNERYNGVNHRNLKKVHDGAEIKPVPTFKFKL